MLSTTLLQVIFAWAKQQSWLGLVYLLSVFFFVKLCCILRTDVVHVSDVSSVQSTIFCSADFIRANRQFDLNSTRALNHSHSLSLGSRGSQTTSPISGLFKPLF